jgi:ribosomal protein L11 methylase PrmA
MNPERVPGSFRDPGGQVYRSGDRILRALHGEAAAAFRAFDSSRCLGALRERGFLVGFEALRDVAELPAADLWLEHPRLAVISHPYEWPFAVLREAALFHLDVQLVALDHGFKLRDASAYNVQFERGLPLFIDLPSFAPYVEGEHWFGHRQFCEQFLNPLLLRARFGVPHHAWYRGAPDGIATGDLYELCGWRDWLSPRHLMHVLLPVRLQRWASRRPSTVGHAAARPLPRTALRALLEGLRAWIGALTPRGHSRTTWSEYESDNSYEAAARQVKHRVIREFVAARKPRLMLDVGCNSGEYSALALDEGATQVVGLDSDIGALDAACERRARGRLALLPLYMDVANPSPGQGWRQQEFPRFNERVQPDTVLALAVVHHLALGRNIPLAEVIATLVSQAGAGLVEFVPKDDPTARRMLALKRDIFPDYGAEQFSAQLARVARIVAVTPIPSSGRVIYEFERDAR